LNGAASRKTGAASSPSPVRSAWRKVGLSIVIGALFLLCTVAQAIVGAVVVGIEEARRQGSGRPRSL